VILSLRVSSWTIDFNLRRWCLFMLSGQNYKRNGDRPGTRTKPMSCFKFETRFNRNFYNIENTTTHSFVVVGQYSGDLGHSWATLGILRYFHDLEYERIFFQATSKLPTIANIATSPQTLETATLKVQPQTLTSIKKSHSAPLILNDVSHPVT
jgi:hypothetical protein